MKFCASYPTLCALFISCISCIREAPQIKVVCERPNETTYLLRWEILPPISGKVKIYPSFDPSHFEVAQPPLEANILDGAACFPVTQKEERYFFLLKFNNRFEKITAARFANAERIKNIRNIGGYVNKDDKTIKWEKIYRSGDIDMPKSEIDLYLINRTKPTTIFDFRDEKDKKYPPDTVSFKSVRRICSPIPDLLTPEIIEQVLAGKMRKGDALLYMEAQYLDMYRKGDLYFKPMFDCLLNPENYPVWIVSERGTDRVGAGIVLLMAALDVPHETILEEFLLSKNQFNPRNYINAKKQIPLERQEVISLLLNPQERILYMIRSQMVSDYGSVEGYLEQKLQLDGTKRQRLKELLLY